MANSDNQQLSNKVELLWTVLSGLSKSIHILRLIGFGLIVFAILDFLDIVIPPNFTNPFWEFEMIGNLVERVPIPLIGLALVFLGEREGRRKRELVLIKYLSWFSLVTGIFFMLLIPLGVFNTFRINQSNTQQITTRANQGISRVKTFQKRLQEITTFDQMEALLNELDQSGSYPEITDAKQFEAAKKQLTTYFAQGEKELTSEAKNKQTTQQLKLLKKSFKWNFGALISGFLFISIWRGIPWVR